MTAVPDRPVLLYERFTGPCRDEQPRQGVLRCRGRRARRCIPTSCRSRWLRTARLRRPASPAAGHRRRALFYLRRLQTFDDKKRSTLDAMNYSASVGLTAHLDQVLFPTPGPLHPNQILSNLDQYRMYDSWLALHREGKATVRLQMNFLQNQNDPALPELKERLRNQFQFFGDDMLMTGSIGEWAAPLGSGAVWQEAQRLVAQAGWRNENSVGNLAGLRQVVEAYEAVNKEFDITELRWMVHHVPSVNADLLNAAEGAGMRRADGRVPMGDVQRSEGRRRSAVQNDRRSRHSGRHPRRWRSHRATQSLAAHLFRGDRRELVRRRRSTATSNSRVRKRFACLRAATAGSCAWKTRSARSSPASSPISRCSTGTTSRCPKPRSRRSARC